VWLLKSIHVQDTAVPALEGARDVNLSLARWASNEYDWQTSLSKTAQDAIGDKSVLHRRYFPLGLYLQQRRN